MSFMRNSTLTKLCLFFFVVILSSCRVTTAKEGFPSSIYAKQMKEKQGIGPSLGKSVDKWSPKEKTKITFKEVAGCDEAKEELQEVVEFLKNPEKFTSLGARIPKGVLCVGAPGTGKTLLAKATAGEANCPFFSISGSDFVEMFAGVGARRIRDLFDQARKLAPCIIFIDEIDAIGRQRSTGLRTENEEREQALNQLLVEMDGFDSNETIIVIGATNRPDILDSALLRPGRFDRMIEIYLPDIKGRHEILKVHAQKIKLDSSINLLDIACNTAGASGADLENILNEAALLAAKKGRSAVTQQEAMEACDKVRYGKERLSIEMDIEEKKVTAIHESGHAIVSLFSESGDPIHKVTIIPRGFALGATHFIPKKNRWGYWKKEALDQLAILMGGRAAEELFIGDISSGAQMDLSQATQLAKNMVCDWGMSEGLGPVSYTQFGDSGSQSYLYLEKSYSEQTAREIEEEVKHLLEEAYQKAKNILEENKHKLLLMVDLLLEFETIYQPHINAVLERAER